jgi:hypothetical protein
MQASFLNWRLRILPAGLFGSSLTARNSLGTLKADRRDFKKDFSACGSIFSPGRATIKI